MIATHGGMPPCVGVDGGLDIILYATQNKTRKDWLL